MFDRSQVKSTKIQFTFSFSAISVRFEWCCRSADRLACDARSDAGEISDQSNYKSNKIISNRKSTNLIHWPAAPKQSQHVQSKSELLSTANIDFLLFFCLFMGSIPMNQKCSYCNHPRTRRGQPFNCWLAFVAVAQSPFGLLIRRTTNNYTPNKLLHLF